MYLLAPFILQNFSKKILELIQSYEDVCQFWDQNSPFVPNKFFGTNRCYYFHLPIGLFHCAKFKQILTTNPELWRCIIFGSKVVHLSLTIFFGGEIITFILIYLLAPFIVQNFKKILPADPEVWGCAIYGFPKIKNFFRKLVNEPCLFYSSLSTCQKSKPDINLLVKYWWLKNTDISLAEGHFCV